MRKEHSPVVKSVDAFELTKAKQTIDQFVYSCSHTLRAPLKSIAGLVYLLTNNDGNNEIDPKFYLESIEKTVSKMESLLDEFEQFLSNSRLELSSKPVDINKEVTNVLGNFKETITNKKIRVSLIVNQPVDFFTDENRFQVLLSHLVSNAIVFQKDEEDDKQISIHVTLNSEVCIIKVTDNGIGIKDEAKAEIFRLFYRGSEQSKGTGVGLYIVCEILNKVGGTISFTSELKKGSSFLISVPNLTQ
ncbi:MAG TPA: HAMP domain-containing sensor histidine kinase [Flavobacterium sp.]|nr:HAMP domain-containing sensor histidine kinase [Flavobacterium sp.]